MYEVFMRLLTASGMTTADVCRAIGCKESTFSNWKTRQNMISADIGIKIAAYFHVSLDYLYGVTAPDAPGLSENETLLVRGFNAADESTKRTLLLIARDALGAKLGASGTSHISQDEEGIA